MPDPERVTDGYLARVLHEFVIPAAKAPAVPFDDLAAYHVPGEPVPVNEALCAPYEPFAVGQRWGPAWSTTWFRLRGRVPADWADREVALCFEIGGAGDTGFGAEALVWREGRPAQGLSPNHTQYVLTRTALAEEPVELYVEAAANPRPPWGASPWPALTPDPGGAPLFTLARAELCVINPELRAFADDFRVLLELLQVLPRSDPRAGRVRRALEAAVRELELEDIPRSMHGAWSHLLAALAAPAAPDGHRISAVGHAHLDTAWLWPLRETVRKCARTFSTAVRLMEDYPEYTFACSQAVHLEWVKDRYPELWARIREKVVTGQFEPTGCMWVEPDCNLPSGESLVRQIVYGKRFYLDELGVETRGAWLPDTFGFSPALPQILREGGVDWFFTQKLSWNQDNEMPHHSFVWEGIDGSRVFAHFPPSNTYGGGATVRELIESVRRFKDSSRANRSLYPYGYGDGGGGPTALMLETLRRVANLDGVPRVALQGPQAFFAAAAAETSSDWPVWVGELYLELHRGTYTTHADVKLANRRAELGLRDAELWAAAASWSGAAYPHRSLEQAWKTLLVHQFHDILPGAGIGWVYDDAARDHRAVLGTVASVVADATGSLADTVETEGCLHPVVVFNSASHDRVGLVEIDVDPAEAAGLIAVGVDGDRSPLQIAADDTVLARVHVPACGYATYDITEGSADPVGELQVGYERLENDRLQVTFDDAGLITSIYDKHSQREVLAPNERANVLQLHDDHPNFFDAWDVDRFAFDSVTDMVALDHVEVVERGPLRAALQFERSVGNSRITQWVSLSAGAARIVFLTEVDWRESHRFLKVAFPVAVHASSANYEIQFGHIARPTHASTSWDRAKFEVWGHQWADLAEGDYGVALLNDCKYGYDIRGSVLRLSLLRSPTWPDPTADRGSHRFAYALLPHAGDLRDGRVIEEARELNIPLRAVRTSPHPGTRERHGSFVSVDRAGVLIEAVKRADRGPGLVIRLAEAWGRRTAARICLPEPVAAAWRTDLLERDITALPVDDGAIAVFLRPFQLLTIRVELAR